MAITVEQFVKRLEECGILSAETIREFVPPNASPKDGEELARNLVRNRRLTKFQAEEIWRGKGNRLVLANYVLLERASSRLRQTVYKAYHRRLHRLVAIKVFRQDVMKDPSAVGRLQRGVETAAKLRHPNIVVVDDADCASGVCFLVMEYVDGSNLYELVKKDGSFSVEDTINYVLQAAQGLAAAHAEGIVHGAITPARLLLAKNRTIKILGFGLATVSAIPQPELVEADTIMEAVDYMAPEHAMDMDTTDARADIYSLGCTLFYLLTGKPPYDGDSRATRVLAHQNRQIPSLREIRPEISISLEGVFGRMVAKNVDHRYQTMAEAIANLERCRACGNIE